MVDQAAALNGTTLMQSLLQGIKDEARMGGPGNPPANDEPGEGDIDKASPCRHRGEIIEPLCANDACDTLPVWS